ncbi:MAG: porin [Gammaproteobacteria bacterium]|nr:porin [Gammaproteobacteria bacterium]
MQTKRLLQIFAPLFALLLAPAAQAVVVVGGDNDWEVSFDGNVNGFYVIEDSDPRPANPAAFMRATHDGSAAGMTSVNTTRLGGNITPDQKSSRIRTGLLPAFFSFNVRSPEVAGLRGSARISFAPQIQIDNRKNNFGSGQQAGAQIDMREVFFNIDGEFGTVSVGRTLSLHQRHNILTDMTLFGVGAQGGQAGGGTTLGRIGYGYVYPQFNARISYKTPQVNGFQLEIGIYDPSRIASDRIQGDAVSPTWNETSSPRFETEATYATTYTGGTLKAWLGGLWQTAEIAGNNAPAWRDDEVTAYGIHGGAVLGFEGFELTGSGYVGEALGTTLMLDADAVDYCGDEREHSGYIIQGTYTFNGRTKFGVSYGASMADETDNDKARRTVGAPSAACTLAAAPADPTSDPLTNTVLDANVATAFVGTEEQNALTVGLYHDVTSWFKVMAEYSKVEHEWFDGATQEADVFAVGSFFLW